MAAEQVRQGPLYRRSLYSGKRRESKKLAVRPKKINVEFPLTLPKKLGSVDQ